MTRLAIFNVLLTSLVFLLHAQQYQLSGTIKNQADFPVKNLVVKLSRAQHQAITDTAGNFLISGSVGTIQGATGRSVHTLLTPRFQDNGFQVAVAEKNTHIAMELFTAQGRRIGTKQSRTVGAGEHRLQVVPEQSGVSIIIANVMVGTTFYRFKLLRSGSAYYSNGSEQYQSATLGNRSVAAPLDTLVIYRKDSIEYAIPVTAASARYQILLDLLPYEITEDIAIKEDRRGPEQVGVEYKDQNIYPYDLWQYLTGPEDAWCSEFLCWAYRVAGYPTGTDEGTATRPRWLLKGNTNIRSWFQDANNKHEWIDRTSPKWETFVPVYGDFVRYDNSAGGHTGIVRWVSGTTMYTVEGNVSNQVRLRTLTNYKSNTSIDGFGRRSGVRQDSHTQV